MYGKTAKKYDTFPELLTPLISVKDIQIHANIKQQTSSIFGIPIPSWIESFSRKMSFLKLDGGYNQVFECTKKSYTK